MSHWRRWHGKEIIKERYIRTFKDSDIFLFDQSFVLSRPKADDPRPILLDTSDDSPGTTDPKNVNYFTFTIFLLSIWIL